MGERRWADRREDILRAVGRCGRTGQRRSADLFQWEMGVGGRTKGRESDTNGKELQRFALNLQRHFPQGSYNLLSFITDFLKI